MTHDAIIVGAGPAGAATGLLLAASGVRVLVLDRARFPRPKICGEYLSPEAARILDRLGVLKDVDDAGAVPLRGMVITAPDGRQIVGTYSTSGTVRGYRDHALALPRLVLDRLLVERLRGSSAEVRERCRVTDLLIEGDRVIGVEAVAENGGVERLRARLVVGADGRNSVVARRLGLITPHRWRRMALMTYASGPAPAPGFGTIVVDPPDYAIINPVAPGRLNVSLVVPLDHAAPHSGRLETFFAARAKQVRHLVPLLSTFERDAPVQALGPLAYHVRAPRHGGVMLVGDAAGFYDPFTGEGVYTALRSAELLAETAVDALRRDDCSAAALASYDRGRRASFRDKERLARGLQFVVGHRWLANLVARSVVSRPVLLETLMGVFGDFIPPRDLLRPSLWRREVRHR
jgi:flavin-dependent dehydrogenase